MPLPLLAALIVAAGTLAFSKSLNGVFVLDDVRAIVRNPTIRTLWPPSTPLSPPSASTVAGRPIANLSFAINVAAWPSPALHPAGDSGVPGVTDMPDATGFHVGNVLIHLASALLLFGVVRRTCSSPRIAPEFGVNASWIALSIALIWVVHPLQTAAVTYVVQRVESLMGLFYLLTLYCAIRALGDRHAGVWAAASVISCAAGMATKEVMVTAPIMVALWDWSFGGSRTEGTSRVRTWLYVGLAATWIILGALVLSEHRAPSVDLSPAMVWSYLLTQAAVVVHYLRLVFVPMPLAFLYDWQLTHTLGSVAWQAALLTALVLLTAIALVRRHPAGFIGAWFFLILAPSSSVLPIVTEVAAEHRMYLPLAAVIALVVTGLFIVATRFQASAKRGAFAGALALAIVVALLVVATRARNDSYGSAEALWRDNVSARPSDARPRVAYGDALAVTGRLVDAEAQFTTAATLAPADPAAHVRLGAVLAQQRKFDAAISHLENAIALRPDDVDAHRFLADVYAIERQDQLAVQQYDRALALLPDDVRLLASQASILADSRDDSVRNPPRARELAERAVRLTSRRDPRTLVILSVAQAASRQFTEAAATAREAAGLARARGDGNLVSALEYRASAYESAARQFQSPQR